MKTSLLPGVIAAFVASVTALVPISADQAQAHPIVAPTTYPSITYEDPWNCHTIDAQDIFFSSAPRPTGSLRTAINSFASVLRETCVTSGTMSLPCAYPDKSLWCGITTALPTELLSEYSEYASSASSWWSVQSSSALSVADMCHLMWFYIANLGVPDGAIMLNQTLIHGECYAEAQASQEPESTTPTTTEPTPGQTESATTPTPTSTSNDPEETGKPEESEPEEPEEPEEPAESEPEESEPEPEP
ncbi:hypothetical protein VTJ04DRAFT_3119 [Mycothermus thermophilus]|uniref:uncharacterized protein n=1 Tax=Humicola insolens TaxID=85995 RepID=UPI0037426F21